MVAEEQGRELADELGIRFMETSAKVNEGVEEAFFTLARCVVPHIFSIVNSHRFRDIKTRLIDSQADVASPTTGVSTDGAVRVNQPINQTTAGCCS